MFEYIKLDLVNILKDQKKINPNSPLIHILDDLLSNHTVIQKQAFELLAILYNCRDEPHALICHILGLCFFEAVGTQRDGEKAFKLFERASTLQYTHSNYWLGTCYADGRGVAEDQPKAHALREKAAKHDHVVALFYLGHCYRNGIRVETDLKKSFELTLAAAEKGMSSAETNTGLNYKWGCGVARDSKKAFYFLNRAVKQGSILAAFHLGMFYYEGDDSIDLTQDFKKACEFFKIAKDECIEAKYYLGLCYLSGKGTEKDERLAVELFSDAGINGKNKDALYQLALCYSKGIGTIKDRESAIKLFTELAEEGRDDAILQLAELHKDSEIPVSKKVLLKARDLFLQDFFGLRLEEIRHRLSFLHKDGEFSEKDLGTALQWFSRKEDKRSEIQYELQLLQKESKQALVSYNVLFMKRRFLSSTPYNDSAQNDDKQSDLEKTFISKMESIRNCLEKQTKTLVCVGHVYMVMKI